MTDQEKRKGGGAKLTRSETVTVRLDPKLRYLAELAALKHRRTLSSFIEWAIEDSLSRVKLREGSAHTGDHGTTVADEMERLWDVEDSDRFAKLALRYPELLTFEEQKRWKLIRENGYLWRGAKDKTSGEWRWEVKEEGLQFDRLRAHWESFCAVARGEGDPVRLPSWEGQTPPEPKGGKSPFEEDEFPF